MQLNPNHTVFLQKLHSLWSKISKKLFKLVEFPIFSISLNFAAFPNSEVLFHSWGLGRVTSTKEALTWKEASLRLYIEEISSWTLNNSKCLRNIFCIAIKQFRQEMVILKSLKALNSLQKLRFSDFEVEFEETCIRSYVAPQTTSSNKI